MSRSTSRRDFLVQAWRGVGAFLAGTAAWTGYEVLRPFDTGAKKGKIAVGDPTKFAVGSATYFPEGGFYVTNAQNHLFALSQKCPHLGCRVPYCKSSGRFECACHGSIYDLGGERIAGPTPRGMDQYAGSVEKNNLIVDLSSLTNGPDPGAKSYYTPSKGPSCIGKA